MSISFVRPLSVRLDLSGGDWLEVRERLGYGAQQKLATSGIKQMATAADNGAGNTFNVDLSAYQIERMLAYIVEWSARNPDGSPMKVSRDAFAALTQAAADEINAALDAHIEAMSAEGNVNTGRQPIDMPSLSAGG